ncbi:MAG: hypothetical protein V5A79_05715 [Candidatus Bipolaricaulota bacterium]
MNDKRRSMKGKGAEIFFGEEEKAGEEDKEGVKEEKKKEDIEEKKNRIRLEDDVDKEKAGFYLREDVTEELEFVWVKARSVLGEKISKSDIVNLALMKLIQEFNENPEDNFLIDQWKNS